MILLANVNSNVVVQKNGKVKDKSWEACKKQLLSSIPDYIENILSQTVTSFLMLEKYQWSRILGHDKILNCIERIKRVCKRNKIFIDLEMKNMNKFINICNTVDPHIHEHLVEIINKI